jgi:hypothetical protein
MALRSQRPSEPHAPQNDEASRGSRRAQINAYNSAIDDSPGRPPEPPSFSPQGSLSSQQQRQEQEPSLDSVVLLLEQLSRQFADTRIVNEEAIASLERRSDRFIHESSDQVHLGSLLSCFVRVQEPPMQT